MTRTQPVLRAIHCADVEDLASYVPATPTHFRLWVQLLVGPDDEPTALESVELEILTPSWLASELSEKEPAITLGRGKLFVARFDYRAIEAALQSAVRACASPTWSDVGCKLTRIGRWEFEDHREVADA